MKQSQKFFGAMQSSKKRLWFSLASLPMLVAPIAIVVACGNDSNTRQVDAQLLASRLTQLKPNLTASQADSLSWENVPQVPYALTNDVASVEYLLGDYATESAASAATEWSLALPRTKGEANAKFWARLVPKANVVLTKSLFDLTDSAALKDVAPAPTQQRPEISVDVTSFVTALTNRVDVIDVSNATRVSWQGIINVPDNLKNAIAGVEYLVGNFATQAQAAAAKSWTSTLPTSVSDIPAADRYVWARLVAKPGAKLSTEYVNLTASAKLADLKANPAPAVTGVASNWVYPTHREVQFTERTPSGLQNSFEIERNYFTPTANDWVYNTSYEYLWRAMQLNIMRSVKPLSDINNYDQNYQITSVTATNDTRSGKKRFELIESIVLTDESGKETVFDKDFSPNDITSDDPRDINSKFFSETFRDVSPGKKILKLSLNLRPKASSTYWRKNFTGENGSTVSAKDLYLGMVFGMLTNPRSRLPLSGLSATDTSPVTGTYVDASNAILGAVGAKRPSYGLQVPDKTYGFSQYDYLNDAVGLNVDALRDLSKMGDMVKDRVTYDAEGKEVSRAKDQVLELTFDKDNSSDTSINRDVFLEYLTSASFGVLPYTEIMSWVRDPEINNQLKTTLTTAGKLTEAQYQQFANSLAFKSGYYHSFFVKRNNFYSAGKYFLKSVSPTEIVGVINENFLDERWLNQRNINGDRTIVETYRIRFQADLASVDSEWTNYQNGNGATSTVRGLSASQLYDLRQNMSSYGTRFGRGFSALNSVDSGSYNNLTVMPVKKDKYPQFYFNNNFAKTLYGVTPEQIDKETGNYNNGGIIANLASGPGFEFRKLLAASMNAYSFVRESLIEGQNAVDWTSLFAPEQDIYGSDLTPQTALHIIDTYYGQNPGQNNSGTNYADFLSKFVFQKDKNGVWGAVPIQRSTYYNSSIAGSFSDKFGPSKTAQVTDPINSGQTVTVFDLLRRAFKDLLDRTVGEYDPNNPLATQLIWEMPYSFGGTADGSGTASIKAQKIYSAYKQMMATIDPRLRVVATLKPTQKVDGVYKDAEIVTEDWPGDSTWSMIQEAADETGTKRPFYTTDRFMTSESGLGFAVTPQGNPAFKINAPTEAIYYSFGHLQRGVLLLQSYYADESNQAAQTLLETPVLRQLKLLTTIAKNVFNNDMSSVTAAGLKLTSSFANQFIAALNNFKFENLWKSDLKKIDIEDYLGLFGLEEILRVRQTLNAKAAAFASDSSNPALTDDETKALEDIDKVYNHINDLLNGSFSTDVWNELQKLNTKDLVDALLAWQALTPESYNPLTSVIGDRQSLSMSLIKTWLLLAGNSLAGGSPLSAGNTRVDLDYKDNFYLGLPLYQDVNGEWKTVFEGGITF